MAVNLEKENKELEAKYARVVEANRKLSRAIEALQCSLARANRIIKRLDEMLTRYEK